MINNAAAKPVWLISLPLILVWIIQLRYPPLSYPQAGLATLVLLCAMALIFTLRSARTFPAALPRPLLWGGLFLLWALFRWGIDGFPIRGAEETGTLLWAAAYCVAGYSAARLAGDAAKVTACFLVAISFMGLTGGAYAVWQFFVSYDDNYKTLMQAIGNRPPDYTEIALLHHLQLRRVAGWFGDPNALATFSAIALCASIELGTWRNKALKVLPVLSGVACLAAVYFSGSRGGVLNVVAVIILFGGWLGYSRFKNKNKPNSPSLATVAVMAVLLHTCNPVSSGSSVVREISQSAAAPETSWQWRSSTITERLHYLHVGWQMVKMSPVIGLGPGSVETHFGRLKPPEAREARYLHNWVMQITAELGMLGLILFCCFVISVFKLAWTCRVPYIPAARALLFIIALILADALIQLTWNQRELMSTWGCAVGLILASSVSSTAISPIRKWPSGLLLVPVVVLLVLDYKYLTAKGLKQTAADLAYSGEPVDAERYWTRASSWWTSDPEPYAARAALALSRGEISAARLLMRNALKYGSESAALNSQAAGMELATGQVQEADKFASVALRLYPAKPDYNYQKALILQKLGSPDKALPYAQWAAKYNYMEQDVVRYQSLVEALQRETITSGTQ